MAAAAPSTEPPPADGGRAHHGSGGRGRHQQLCTTRNHEWYYKQAIIFCTRFVHHHTHTPAAHFHLILTVHSRRSFVVRRQNAEGAAARCSPRTSGHDCGGGGEAPLPAKPRVGEGRGKGRRGFESAKPGEADRGRGRGHGGRAAVVGGAVRARRAEWLTAVDHRPAPVATTVPRSSSNNVSLAKRRAAGVKALHFRQMRLSLRP